MKLIRTINREEKRKNQSEALVNPDLNVIEHITWIFGLFLVTPCALTNCHVVISKQGWQCVRAGRSSRCVIGRWPRNMRTTRSDLDSVQRKSTVEPGIVNRSEASRTSQTIRLARRCKRWHPLVPGRRYETRSRPLSEYMSHHLSLKLIANCVPLSRIKWEIYSYISVFLVVHKDTAEYTA